MAHRTPGIPWDVLASNFEYILRNPSNKGITNLYPRLKPTQGEDLNHFVRVFAKAVGDHSDHEREKYPDSYQPAAEDEIIINDEVAKKISPVVAELRNDQDWLYDSMGFDREKARLTVQPGELCGHPSTEATLFQCSCPLPLSERKAAAFQRAYTSNDCFQFSENRDAFFNIELVKTLILCGEMDPILRACAHEFVDYEQWWCVAQCYCCSYDAGWDQLAKRALESYIRLNLLYCFPELWDPAVGMTETRDYRLTAIYQEMLTYCTTTQETSEIASFPHRRFFGVIRGQFSSFGQFRDKVRWEKYISSISKQYPFGEVTIDDFLGLEIEPPFLPTAPDIDECHHVLYRKGLPLELAMDITDLAYSDLPRRLLEVPNHPLHPENRDYLEEHLEMCWMTMIRCDMMAKELKVAIPWDGLVSRCLRSCLLKVDNDEQGLWKYIDTDGPEPFSGLESGMWEFV
ncbi:hypothetical protein F5Y15DRAFT_193538 [Xylariaceae sp. FL0016]|nr:hypothetical protein F5Y15DRAFT_193538 [Xylariaceae sp. FL0016]